MKLNERTINSERRLTLRRLLPTTGEVLVQQGQVVQPLDVVARVEVPYRYQVINVAHQLAQREVDMRAVMLKKEGDEVQANEPVAVLKGRIPFLQRSARAQTNGRIAKVGVGRVLLEVDRTETEMQAFVHGVVSHIIPQRGVIIETRGALLEAACGFGGEAYGRLKSVVSHPSDVLSEEALANDEVEQAIVVGGRSLTEDLVRYAEARRIRGIIVGSIDARLLTLDPPPKVRVVATEGFGDTPMSPASFALFTALIGREVSIRGQTPMLASTTLREIEQAAAVVLSTSLQSSTANSVSPPANPESSEIQVGDRVRVTRGHFFGAIGQVNAIPKEPLVTELGIKTAGAHVTIEGATHFVPWANLEQVV